MTKIGDSYRSNQAREIGCSRVVGEFVCWDVSPARRAFEVCAKCARRSLRAPQEVRLARLFALCL
eukprot:3027886-Pyramimonas_sp.AAC.2